MKKQKTRIFAVKNLALAFLLGCIFLYGYIASEYRVFPYRYVEKVRVVTSSIVKQYLFKQELVPEKKQTVEPETTIDNKTIETIFLNVDLNGYVVPVSSKGAGGALTSFGKELLLLTHEGGIFLAADDQARRTRILPPQNGLPEYKVAASSEKYRELDHSFNEFRYNDILYYSEKDYHSIVVSYTEWLPNEECYGTTIARLELPSGVASIMDIQADSESWEIIYRTKPCIKLNPQSKAIHGQMAGGRIAYIRPHTIVLASGDYAWDGVNAAEAYPQQNDNDYGKVLEIDLNLGTAKTLTLGQRNMQGIVVDSSGQTWTVEHGPRGGDELTRIEEGKNYGWPEAILGTRYNKLPWPLAVQYGRHDNFALPTYAWVPSVATSGLTQIKGFSESWDGDLLVATLRAKQLFRLRIRENRVIFAEPMSVGDPIRYVHQHTDGRIVLWTDTKKLIFITPGSATFTNEIIAKIISESGYDELQQKKISSTVAQCNECHSFEQGVNQGAPGLHGIFNSTIASTSYGGYSEALKTTTGQWTETELVQFLQDPQSYVPGTTMPDTGIDESFVIDGVIKVLKGVE